jgi:DNA polymerase-3 subunit gamma/tau
VALALYRKYRPRTFAEIIGQEHVTEPLSQALRSGRLNHAYLFSGPRGCGKTSSARILARSLNCEQGPTPEPCGVCGSCKSLANDGAGSIDVIEIDAASHGGVDDARELREKAFFAPASSRYKIYVIDEAHMVSSAGFNALLKLVEEPPDYVKFIFATTEPDKVLGTIRSRTHHYPFRLIPPAVLRPYLQQLTEAEGVTVEPSVLPLVVRAGGGSARDSLSILDQLIAGSGPEGVTYSRAVGLLGVTDVTLIDEMCDAVANGDGAAAYATIDRVAEAGHEPRRFASDLLERFRDLIVLQQVPDAVAKGLIDGPADQLEAMAGQAHRLGAATLSRCADILHNGLVEMRGTTAPRLLLELVAARMLLPGADTSASALLQRLERLERGVTLAPSAAGQSHSSDVRGEHPPTDAGDEGGSAGDPGAGNGGPGGGVGAGGGGKAAAMAAAAAARAGSARPAAGGASARPVSPAAPAVPVSSAPAVPASSVPAVPSSSASVAPASSGSVPQPAPSSAVGADVPPAGPVTSGGPVPDSQLDGPVGTSSTAAGSAARHGEGGEPDWNRVADGGGAEPVDAGYYDEAPPWDEEPPEDEPSPPQMEGRPAVRPQAAGRSVARPDAEGHSGARSEMESRSAARPPAAGDPDAQPQSESRPAARPDARLERVRTAWQALGQHQPKVRAMQDYGIGVRDLEGDTIVFAAPTPALMERFLNWREAITTEFRKSPGGDWRIRCEVGTVGPAVPGDSRDQSAGRDQPAGRRSAAGSAGRPVQQAGSAGGSARNTGRTESHPPRPQRAPATDADEDWPEPARPAVSGSAPAAMSAGDDSGWPEPSRPAGSTPANTDRAGAGRSGPTGSPSAYGDPHESVGQAATTPGTREPVRPSVADAGWPEPVRPAERAGNNARADGTAAGDDGGWPEPVRPGAGAGGRGGTGHSAGGGAGSASAVEAAANSAWPEPARPGAGAPGRADRAAPASGATTPGVPGAPASAGAVGSGSGGSDGSVGGTAFGGGAGPGGPVSGGGAGPGGAVSGGGAGPGGAAFGGGAGPGGAAFGGGAGPGGGAIGGGSAFGGAAVSAATPAAGPGAGRAAVSAATQGAGLAAARGAAAAASQSAVSAVQGAGPAAAARGGAAPGGASPAAPARSAAAEAARAALANARSGVAAKPAAGSAAGRGAVAPGGSARSFSDVPPPVEEAPYDPEYDGPPAAFEGFDPGDEPLDDVIDEKTARQSGEEQAIQLLRAAFGAEKIGEL